MVHWLRFWNTCNASIVRSCNHSLSVRAFNREGEIFISILTLSGTQLQSPSMSCTYVKLFSYVRKHWPMVWISYTKRWNKEICYKYDYQTYILFHPLNIYRSVVIDYFYNLVPNIFFISKIWPKKLKIEQFHCFSECCSRKVISNRPRTDGLECCGSVIQCASTEVIRRKCE